MTRMAAEIKETPAVLSRQWAMNAEANQRLAARFSADPPRFAVTIARGSSDHAALYLKTLVEQCVSVAVASLSPSLASLYHARLRLEGAAAFTISQSGRSPDIVAMQRAARDGGAYAVALVNDAASPIAAEADATLPLQAGDEIAVAATKTMIASLFAAASLVAHWSGLKPLLAALEALPSRLTAKTAPTSHALIEALSPASSLFTLGRGATLAAAMEAALKLKETSALHAEAFSSAEVLHGPAGLVERGFPVLAFLPTDAARAGMLEALDRLAGFGARAFVVDVEAHARWPTLSAPDAGHALLQPIASLYAFYVFAEALARHRGRDPDSPPHLRKVTQTW